MIVYRITNTVTGKCYVGQTRRTLHARFRVHKAVVGRTNACRALSDAMVKYGAEQFIAEVLESCSSQAELDAAEIRWIKALNSMVPGGYNLTLGGAGKSGYKHTEESRRKMSASQRARMPPTEETKRKVSASLIGNKRAAGLRHSDATKALISAKGKGRLAPKSPEHRRRLALAHIGMRASEHARAKMSEARSGERNVNAKLTAADIRAIRADPRPQSKIGADYGIRQNTVSAIKLHQSWRHVE